MNEHEKINYVEFPAKNIEATKAFFTAVFGWSFVDYGPEYTAFSNEGLDGGFFQSALSASTEKGSTLIGNCPWVETSCVTKKTTTQEHRNSLNRFHSIV